MPSKRVREIENKRRWRTRRLAILGHACGKAHHKCIAPSDEVHTEQYFGGVGGFPTRQSQFCAAANKRQYI